MSVDNYNFFYKKNRQLWYIYADTYVELYENYIKYCDEYLKNIIGGIKNAN